ncbi:ParB/RepB/Spo0J family partition protein [Phenylobacterium montanum]|uniref:Chromosome-partitioning protein ParB n=1 Tax=Phenylobacterium montanum TaxID=2823693 RepID=A0A975ITA0_9CAUL|nr:ParB/RepB/Spo0J family partition protein [Caulobacter sp. S6]QUD86642.1 ParB/RepB/Spo0J family partition protein [Caulobacter sp. S6]
MAEYRRGLGRGLSALLDEQAEAAVSGEGAAPQAGVREVPIELLHRNPDQPRRDFVEADIEELAASIREKGVLQPILVRPMPDSAGEYQIVAGERRWRAAQKAGLYQMPVVVRELDDLAALEIAIIENVQRADLNAVEEAMGYKALMERFGRTQDAVAQNVGKSRSHVANALRLLSLPEAVQLELRAGRLTSGHARALITAPDPAGLAREVIARGLNVRETESLARKAQGGEARPRNAAKPAVAAPKDADTRALEEDLADILGLDVEIIDRGGAGELRIAYATLEQLDDLCQRLTRAG